MAAIRPSRRPSASHSASSAAEIVAGSYVSWLRASTSRGKVAATMGPHMKRAIIAIIAIAAGLGAAHAQGAFYQATEAEIASGPPGSVIRDEPMVGAPAGGIAHRVLYRSTDPDGKADRGVRRHHRPARHRTIRRLANHRLGASDHRHRAALRAVAGDLPVPADRRQPADDGTGLCDRRDRLSGPRHAGAASLSRRRQRSARGDRFRARGAQLSRHRRQPLCGVGPFAGRTGRAVHRHHLGELRARAETARRRGSGAGD